MEKCIEEFEDAEEYKTDRLATQLVRIQRLTEEVCHFHSRDSSVAEQLGSHDATMTAHLESFQVKLDSLRNALPPQLKSDRMIPQLFEQVAGALLMWFESLDFLSCYHNSAYLRLFEPLLAGSHLPDAESQSFASLSLSGVLIADVFSSFTAALKAWVNNWLAVPVCSYFYMPQPAYSMLVHAAMMLTRWTRVAGPIAVKLSNAGPDVPRREFTAPNQSTPALSGVTSCPDLGLPRPPSSDSTQDVSAQILNTLRAQIMAQPNLQIDICGTLDTMAARFEAAREEMAAAQGVDWENDTWDLAAEHCKMKKVRIEKWHEIFAAAASEGTNWPTNASDSVNEGDRETMDLSTGWSVNGFEWPTSGYEQDNVQWESAIFDEIMRDIHY
ncbi:hypothetical protein KJ359_012175 [Pestalotiopsis sp. 9143b]|nr:hypothetical protein KJ359_012175 [Pestalotiopsis sp. 9143b]